MQIFERYISIISIFTFLAVITMIGIMVWPNMFKTKAGTGVPEEMSVSENSKKSFGKRFKKEFIDRIGCFIVIIVAVILFIIVTYISHYYYGIE